MFCLFLASCGERLGVNFVGLARRFEKHVYIRTFFLGMKLCIFLPRGAGRGARTNLQHVTKNRENEAREARK